MQIAMQNQLNSFNRSSNRSNSNHFNPSSIKYQEQPVNTQISQFYKFQNNFSDTNIARHQRTKPQNKAISTSMMPKYQQSTTGTHFFNINNNYSNGHDINNSNNVKNNANISQQINQNDYVHKLKVNNNVDGLRNYQFQFKRTSLPSNRGNQHQHQKKYANIKEIAQLSQFINNEEKQFYYSKNNSQIILPINSASKNPLNHKEQERKENNHNQNNQNLSQTTHSDPFLLRSPQTPDNIAAELEKKVKMLQSQLKFQQKYANQMFKSTQQNKKQIQQLKNTNLALQKKISQKSLLLQQKQIQMRQHLQKLHQKDDIIGTLREQSKKGNNFISILQKQLIKKQEAIRILNDKAKQLSKFQKNELYQSRIKQLNQEIINANNLLALSKLEKTKLIDEIRLKNEMIMMLQVEAKHINHHNLTSSINTHQSTNLAINSAFQDTIKTYQDDIQHLKRTIQRNEEEHRKLRQEVIDYKKENLSLKQELRINALRYSTDRKNMDQQKSIIVRQKMNEVMSVTNRYKVLEQKYAKSLKEIDEKDNFLQAHLVGRAKELQLREYIESVMNSYKGSFQSRISLEGRVKELEQILATYNKPLP